MSQHDPIGMLVHTPRQGRPIDTQKVSPLPPRVTRGTTRFALALAASVLVSFLPIPWSLIGLPISALAVALAIVALIGMRGVRATGLWVFMGIGTLLAGTLAMNYAAAALLADELRAYQGCLGEAITVAAEDRCDAEFERAANERASELNPALARFLGLVPESSDG